MIVNVYIIACDVCRENMQILNANSIKTAFKAARKSPWRSNSNNTEHACPKCLAKIIQNAKKPKAECVVTHRDISKAIKKGE